MGLIDKIKSMFSKQRMPDETRLVLAGVDNVSELRHALDDIITRNEVELKEVEREIDKHEREETTHKEKVKAGTLTLREKENSLKAIKRLRAKMDSFTKRHKIHQENIEIHQLLLDRISEIEAMELKAVRQEQIDEIAVDYQERLEKHKEIVHASRVAHESEATHEDAQERRELDALEKEILSEGKPPVEEPSSEEKVPEERKPEEPKKVEPVAVEKVAAEAPKVQQERPPLRVEAEAEKKSTDKVNVPTERPLLE